MNLDANSESQEENSLLTPEKFTITNTEDQHFTSNVTRAHSILSEHNAKRNEYIEILTQKTLYKTSEELEKEDARNAFFDVKGRADHEKHRQGQDAANDQDVDSQASHSDPESSMIEETLRLSRHGAHNPALQLNLPKEREESGDLHPGPTPNPTPRTHILNLYESRHQKNRSHFELAEPQREKLAAQSQETFAATHQAYFALQNSAEANMQTLYLHQNHTNFDEVTMHGEMMKTIMDEYEYYREHLESLWDDIGRIERFEMVDQNRVEKLFGRRQDIVQEILKEEKEKGVKVMAPVVSHTSSTSQLHDTLTEDQSPRALESSAAEPSAAVWNDKSVQLREQAERIKQKHIRMKYLAHKVKAQWRQFVLKRRFEQVNNMCVIRRKTKMFRQWKNLTAARTMDKFRRLRGGWDAWIQYNNYRYHASQVMRKTLQNVYYTRLIRIAFILWKRWAHFRRMRRLDPQCTDPPKYDVKLLCWDEYIAFRIISAQQKRIADNVYKKNLSRAVFAELQSASMLKRMLHEREHHWIHLSKIKTKKEVFEGWREYVTIQKENAQPNLIIKRRVFKQWKNIGELRRRAATFPEIQHNILVHGFFFRWRKRYLQRRLLENAATVQIITRRPDAMLTYSIIANDHIQYSVISNFNRWKKYWLGRKLFFWYIGTEWEQRRLEILRYYFYTWKHKKRPLTRYALEGIREHLLLQEFERFKRTFVKAHARGSNRIKTQGDLERHQWIRHLFVDFMDDADPLSKFYIFRKLFMLTAYKRQEMTQYRTKMIMTGDWYSDMKFDASEIKVSSHKKLILARKIVSLFMRKQLAQAKEGVDELTFLLDFIRQHIATNRQIMKKKLERDREVALKFLAKEAAIKLAKVSRSFRAVVEHTTLSSVAQKHLEMRQKKQRDNEEELRKKRTKKMEKKMASVRSVVQQIKGKSKKKSQHIWDDILDARVARRSSETTSIELNKKRDSTATTGDTEAEDPQATEVMDSDDEEYADDLPSDIFTGRHEEEENERDETIDQTNHPDVPSSLRSSISETERVNNHIQEYTSKIREMLDKPQDELTSYEDRLRVDIPDDEDDKSVRSSVKSSRSSPSLSLAVTDESTSETSRSSHARQEHVYVKDQEDEQSSTIQPTVAAISPESVVGHNTSSSSLLTDSSFKLFGNQDGVDPFTPQTPTQELEYAFSDEEETYTRSTLTGIQSPVRSRSSSKVEPFENNAVPPKALQVTTGSKFSLVSDDSSKKKKQAVRRSSGEILNYKGVSQLTSSLTVPSQLSRGASLNVPLHDLDAMSEELHSEDEEGSQDEEDNAEIERLSTWLWDQSYRTDPLAETPVKVGDTPKRLYHSRSASRAIFDFIGNRRAESIESQRGNTDEFLSAIISLGKEINAAQVGQSEFSIQEQDGTFTVRFPTEIKQNNVFVVNGSKEIPFHDRMLIRADLARQEKQRMIQEKKTLQQKKLETILRMQQDAASWTEKAAKIANDFERKRHTRVNSPLPASPRGRRHEVRTFRVRRNMCNKDSVTALELILRLNLKQEQTHSDVLAQEIMELRKKIYPLIVSLYEDAERSHSSDDMLDKNLLEEMGAMKLKMTEMERYLGVQLSNQEPTREGVPPVYVPNSTSDQIPIGASLPYLLDVRSRTSFDYSKSPQDKELIQIAIENSTSFQSEWRRKLSLADDESVELQWSTFMSTLVERLHDESSEVREETKQTAQRKRHLLMKQIHNFTQIIQSMRLTILQTKQQQSTSTLYGNAYFEEKIQHIERGLVQAEHALQRSSIMLKELQSVFSAPPPGLGKRSLRIMRKIGKTRRLRPASHHHHSGAGKEKMHLEIPLDIDRSVCAPSPEAPLSPYLDIQFQDTSGIQELRKLVFVEDKKIRSGSFSGASDPDGVLSDSHSCVQENSIAHSARLVKSPLLKHARSTRSRPRSASVSRSHPRSATHTRDLRRAKLIEQLSKQQS
eukprot:CAMPEP_0117437574 /NCGR_PEP_ID=MMETSP0759-20121206/1593_1 /TAXON_ID=63605 /ORGANISM="Percolomonas cosmopolitus, Strain WS" /LENGTH=1945 /DNA_ID=CAMNT_0005229209 /DNA_START=184 /DNA_END=6022 /DNA_ORIENTATION=-